MSEISELVELAESFRDKRDWKKYHTPKNLSLSISIEAAELMEHFQWKDNIDEGEMDEVKDEVADIFIYILYLSKTLNIDLKESVKKKIEKNKEKYPVGESHFE